MLLRNCALSRNDDLPYESTCLDSLFTTTRHRSMRHRRMMSEPLTYRAKKLLRFETTTTLGLRQHAVFLSQRIAPVSSAAHLLQHGPILFVSWLFRASKKISCRHCRRHKSRPGLTPPLLATLGHSCLSAETSFENFIRGFRRRDLKSV